METYASSERSRWLFSRRADFWLACGGAPVALLASLLVIVWHGDRELDALDFVLSEFHLGATYDAIIRRRLWRQRRVDVLLVPWVILALTYTLSICGQTILLTSIAMYAAVWHRGRQSLGVACFYQRGVGGPVSRVHTCLFRGCIYLPMLAALLAYTHLAPAEYDAWTLWRIRGGRATFTAGNAIRIHPGESWVVVAHAIAFGSAYVLGASNASFLLVLAVHHEVQYLYFTYAMARQPATCAIRKTDTVLLTNELNSGASYNGPRGTQAEVKFAASFLLWPVIGFVGAVVGGWLELEWLAPLGVGGLFCHYWLDGRIWTRQSFQN